MKVQADLLKLRRTEFFKTYQRIIHNNPYLKAYRNVTEDEVIQLVKEVPENIRSRVQFSVKKFFDYRYVTGETPEDFFLIKGPKITKTSIVLPSYLMGLEIKTNGKPKPSPWFGKVKPSSFGFITLIYNKSFIQGSGYYPGFSNSLDDHLDETTWQQPELLVHSYQL